MSIEIAVAPGDGIGPEIMEAVLRIFDAAKVPLHYTHVDMGLEYFKKGYGTGMTPLAKETIENLGILFKGPMETPKGKGIKSINVTARKTWNTYANVRRFKTLKGVDTVFSKAGIPINITVLRENIEDTYGGIEFLHSPDIAICYRFITRKGSEQFIRYSFEYAKLNGVKKVTCGHKANIMKMTDGFFMAVFYEIAKEYPEIEVNDLIIDDLCMKMVTRPDKFEMLVLTNLQGDIVSDLCAGLVGGLGFAPSSNIGDNISIFEAVHGTAPDIAGKKIANPTSLLMSGIMMLRHLGLTAHAKGIEEALFTSIEQGNHTVDFGEKGTPVLNTDEFADTVIRNLVEISQDESSVTFQKPTPRTENRMMANPENPNEKVVGMDCMLVTDLLPHVVAETILPILPPNLDILMISNRGTKVWKEGSLFTDCVIHHRARIVQKNKEEILSRGQLFDVAKIISEHFKVHDVEILCEWGDIIGYALAQGQ